MDFQTKLDSLHREIVSALCCIRELPEMLLPHSVYVEEDANEPLTNGHTVYNLYNLTAIFADGMCLLENPGTGTEEKRQMKEICIDHLAELWNTYRYLSGDTPVSNVAGLLQLMEPVAKALITGQFITDFTIHDANFIRRTEANTSFIWLVYQSGTHLHTIDTKQEIRQLKDELDYYEKHSQSDFCLFRYDGQNLFPVSRKELRKWIDNQLTIDN